MDYKDFTNTIDNLNSSKIKTLRMPESCAMSQIPNSFNILLPEIIRIMNANIKQLCNNETIAVFGLQPTAMAITSDLPQKLNRSIGGKASECHFCCNLTYLAIPAIPAIAQASAELWHKAKTLVIDFTTGWIMNTKQYLFAMLNQGEPGDIYGRLDKTLLEQAWNNRTQPKYVS